MEKSELTPKEREAMDLTAKLAGVMREIIGDGPCAAGDWNEVALGKRYRDKHSGFIGMAIARNESLHNAPSIQLEGIASTPNTLPPNMWIPEPRLDPWDEEVQDGQYL